MKNYDFKKAKQLILENQENLKSAALGMHEDWFWTADTIWEDKKFIIDLDEVTSIAGIGGSSWATPTLQLVFKDNADKMIECSIGEGENEKPAFLLFKII
jgi:hypothetical protein